MTRDIFLLLTIIPTVRYTDNMITNIDEAPPQDGTPESTRQVIMRIALSLFAANGYEASGIQDLCARCGISKPTLYYHFGSKRGLLEAIAQEYGNEYLQAVDAAARYVHDLVLNLQQLLRVSLQAAESRPDFVRLYLTLGMAAPESEGCQVLLALRTAIRERLRRLFLAAAEDHGNMRGREALMAELFGSLLDNRMLAAINRPAGDSSRDDIYRIVHQYMHGIFS